jgi:cellulose synthase/poly-beta-1,6-N-acetylglucosamine synthase-like glycosyltransferase
MIKEAWEKIKSNPLVSVVIPTRNSAKTIESCINSIHEQSYHNRNQLEIVKVLMKQPISLKDWGAIMLYLLTGSFYGLDTKGSKLQQVTIYSCWIRIRF